MCLGIIPRSKDFFEDGCCENTFQKHEFVVERTSYRNLQSKSQENMASASKYFAHSGTASTGGSPGQEKHLS